MAKTPLQHAAGGEHHVIKTGTSIVVLFLLAGLMALTIAMSMVNLGSVTANNVVAMVIATVKASLVMYFFMGLGHSTKLTRLWALAGFLVFGLMFLILCDYNARSQEVVRPWNGRPEPAMPRVIDPVKAHEMPVSEDINFSARGNR